MGRNRFSEYTQSMILSSISHLSCYIRRDFLPTQRNQNSSLVVIKVHYLKVLTMKRKHISIIIGLFCITISSLNAQESTIRYGIFGHGLLNMHNANFKELPGVPNCCKNYTEGTGSTIGGGFLIEFPFFSDFDFSFRMSYADYSGLLESTDNIITANGSTPFTHKLDAIIPAISLQPSLMYDITKGLKVHVGFDLNYLLNQKYSQKEVISSPNGTFIPENTRERNATSGDIQENAVVMIAPMIGVGYEFPMNAKRTLFLTPEVQYQHGITNLNNTLDWKVSTIRFGVALKYSPKPTPIPKPDPIPEKKPEEPAKPIIAQTPVTPQKEPIEAQIRAVGLDENGKEFPVAKIVVEEFLSTQIRPLLNYIFFDNNSSEISPKYNKLSAEATNSFSMITLHNESTLQTYYHIMNIIGQRLRENPTAKLTITGCNSNELKEKNNTELSEQRANAVKEYFLKTWNIEEKRLIVRYRNLPEKPSNNDTDDGIAENRRVELSSDTWKIIEPVILNDTIRTSNPPIIRFYPTVNTKADIRDWKVIVSQQNKEYKQFSGTQTPPQLLDWAILNDKNSIPSLSQPLYYTINAENSDKEKAITPLLSIPFEQITVQKKRAEKKSDKEIDRYSLILFDFDRAEIGVANKRILDYIKPRIAPKATVTVTGFTDKIGDDQHNKELSLQRAQNTVKALGKGTAIGEGEKEVFDNSVPEGRFYNRTVTVIVETPISK